MLLLIKKLIIIIINFSNLISRIKINIVSYNYLSNHHKYYDKLDFEYREHNLIAVIIIDKGSRFFNQLNKLCPFFI